jgi:hypothetical protein
MNLHLRRGRALQAAPAMTSLGNPQPAGSPPTLARVVPLPRTETTYGGPPLTTPFEDWCERTGVHPEALGAWEAFVLDTTPGA